MVDYPKNRYWNLDYTKLGIEYEYDATTKKETWTEYWKLTIIQILKNFLQTHFDAISEWDLNQTNDTKRFDAVYARTKKLPKRSKLSDKGTRATKSKIFTTLF